MEERLPASVTGSAALRVRAVRGATTVEVDQAHEIEEVTRELLSALVAQYALRSSDIISAIFTMTSDLRATYPARAARALGWSDVPMLCVAEVDVDGSLARCIRVILHVETTRSRAEVQHVYLRGARALRPDLVSG